MSQELLSIAPLQKTSLSERDPRLRLLTALLFAIAVVSLNQLTALLLALLGAVAMTLYARLPFGRVIRQLLLLEGLMLILLLFLPFTLPGTPLAHLGPLTASQEGLLTALQIVFKANAVMLSLMALVGTLEPITLGHTLARLGMPAKLVHLLLLTVRYLDLLNLEYQRLRQAMRTRAFSPGSNLHTWRSMGWLMGMLLVRSMERSQRILQAMKCRGFDGRLYLLDNSRWKPLDSLYLVTACGLIAMLFVLESLL